MRSRWLLMVLISTAGLTACSNADSSSVWTPTAAALLTPTSKVVTTVGPEATPDPGALITPRPGFVARTAQQMTSPDGLWLAEASFEHLDGGAAGFRVRLTIREANDAVVWEPVNYTQDGLGYVYPALRAWSPDSRTFYYYNMQNPDGCGDFYPIEEAWVGVSVADGSSSTLVLPTGRGHSLSPDGTTLVYASASPPYAIHIRALETLKESILILPRAEEGPDGVQAGGVAWSPDGKSFAFTAAYGDPCAFEGLSFSILRVDDGAQPSLAVLIGESSKLLRIRKWPTQEKLLIEDWDGYSWWIDAERGGITSAPEGDG
jgi:hypothetical protein